MQPSQSRPSNSQYRERDIVAGDLDEERVSPKQRIDAGREAPEYYAKSPPVSPPSYARYSGVENQFVLGSPSISKRVFRAVARFIVAHDPARRQTLKHMKKIFKARLGRQP